VPRWKPDVIVVCVGNNEAWPVNTSDRQIDSDRAMPARLAGVLSASRFLVWASETIRPDKPQSFVAPALDSAVSRVSPEEFADNLRTIAQLARDAHAKLILLSPPVNLYWQPMRTDQFPEWKQWEAFCESIRNLWNAGEQQKAVEMVNAKFAENPDSFFALWIKGIALTDTGDVAGGRELLEQAIEHHPFPENCKRSYRDVIARVAQAEQVPIVDVNDLFVARAAAPTPQGLYIDWCHPTPQGNGIIASAIYETMASEKE
jgi:lysophospholipase L1-like esterase